MDVERRDRVAAARDFLDATEDIASERLVGQAIALDPKRPGEAFRAQRELVVDAVAEQTDVWCLIAIGRTKPSL